MFIRLCTPTVTRTVECTQYQSEVCVGGIRITASLHGTDVLDILLGQDFIRAYIMSEQGTTIDSLYHDRGVTL